MRGDHDQNGPPRQASLSSVSLSAALVSMFPGYRMAACSASGIYRRDIANAKKRDRRLKSSLETELEETGSAGRGTASTNGSKASWSMAAYFVRS